MRRCGAPAVPPAVPVRRNRSADVCLHPWHTGRKQDRARTRAPRLYPRRAAGLGARRAQVRACGSRRQPRGEPGAGAGPGRRPSNDFWGAHRGACVRGECVGTPCVAVRCSGRHLPPWNSRCSRVAAPCMRGVLLPVDPNAYMQECAAARCFPCRPLRVFSPWLRPSSA